LDAVHCLRNICYARRFGSWLYFLLQVIGYHDTLFPVINDNGRDETGDLSNVRLES
jgi:hypothetical protein